MCCAPTLIYHAATGERSRGWEALNAVRVLVERAAELDIHRTTALDSGQRSSLPLD